MGIRFALIAVLLVTGWGCSRPQEDEEIPFEIGSGSASLEREVRGFEMKETREGVLLWKLMSDYAWRFPEESRIQLKTVRIVFYDRDGNENSVLTSQEGSVDQNTEDLTAVGRVRVVSVDGDTLTTEELNYSRLDDRINGPGFVRLAKSDGVLTGTGYEANPDLTDYEVKRDVHYTQRN